MLAASPVRAAVGWLEVRAVQAPAGVGDVFLYHQPPVWLLIVSVALLWVTELASRSSVVNSASVVALVSSVVQVLLEYAL